ncbi:MAG TPA: hypothetical protein VFE96_02305 [Candidatus Bathyarchaeia archaeon]|nr:hypothetical protein [Candidatus Bathyarchaeia archaeon]
MNWKISIRTSLYTCFLVGLAIAAISTGQVRLAAAQSSTPTFVLGVSNPQDPLIVDLQSQTSSLTILTGVSGLSLLGPGSILFIDGNWLQTTSSIDPTILPSLDTTVLTGVPSVVVRGAPTILQNSISGLLKGQVPNLPLIAEGLKIFGTLSDGTRQAAALQIIQGFDYAVNTEFTWAQQHLTNALPSGFSAPVSTIASKTRMVSNVASNDPSWAFVLQLTTDTNDQFAPMGKIISTFTIFSLQNSGSSTHKWYNFFANQTLIPGSVAYNSPWRNLDENDTINVNPSTNAIISSGPGSLITSGPTMVTYTVGVVSGFSGAAVTANQNQSYMLKNTNVAQSAQSTYLVGWDHSIDPRSSSGKLAVSIIPGWTDRIQMNQGIDLHGTFTSTFATLSGTTIVQTASSGVQLAVAGG